MLSLSKTSKRNLTASLVVVLLLLLFTSLLKALEYNCLNSSDVAIYGQALQEMAYSWDFNPWITVRGTNIFADHFDPILIFVSFIYRLLPQHYASGVFLEF
ncbi:hypothetical protein OAB57_01485, partial [Bacteriovoracaceae bacterium]|nr:hypothetical protein [Bacteriovoracaceae bacterium]